MIITTLCVSTFNARVAYASYGVLPWIPVHFHTAEIGDNGHPVPPRVYEYCTDPEVCVSRRTWLDLTLLLVISPKSPEITNLIVRSFPSVYISFICFTNVTYCGYSFASHSPIAFPHIIISSSPSYIYTDYWSQCLRLSNLCRECVYVFRVTRNKHIQRILFAMEAHRVSMRWELIY
jgi:hypothetical protein